MPGTGTTVCSASGTSVASVCFCKAVIVLLSTVHMQTGTKMETWYTVATVQWTSTSRLIKLL